MDDLVKAYKDSVFAYFTKCDGCLSYWMTLDKERKTFECVMRWDKEKSFNDAACADDFAKQKQAVKPYLNGPPKSEDRYVEHAHK